MVNLMDVGTIWSLFDNQREGIMAPISFTLIEIFILNKLINELLRKNKRCKLMMAPRLRAEELLL